MHEKVRKPFGYFHVPQLHTASSQLYLARQPPSKFSPLLPLLRHLCWLRTLHQLLLVCLAWTEPGLPGMAWPDLAWPSLA